MILSSPRSLIFKFVFLLRSNSGIPDPISSPSYFSSSSAIRNASSPGHALHLYVDMHRMGIFVDSFAAVFALKACASLLDFSLIRQTHAFMVKSNFCNHLYVATALVNGYACCDIEHARQFFDEIPERNAVTWNTLIKGYTKIGNLQNACLLFDTMPVRDVASWSAMISGYMASYKWSQGLAMFREMMRTTALKPDGVMMATLISGCSHIGSVNLLGKSLHAYAKKNILYLGGLKENSLKANLILETAFVDLYAKSGVLNYAHRIFERMSVKNVMTWSAMISGLALHGYGKEALSVYREMKIAGIKPNEFTFTAILNACCHAGLVDEGRKHFHSMTEDYGLEINIQHYGCMIDLFGKAGLLEEAYELITTMEHEPNIVVWSSFLASCKMHRRFEMAERVIERALFVANSDGGGIYSLVSDLYALGGKWVEAEQTRNLMAARNVKKVRGSSFIRT